ESGDSSFPQPCSLFPFLMSLRFPMRLTPFLFPVWIVLLPLAGAIAQTTQPEAGASGGREDLSQYYTADVQREWGTWVEPDFPFFSSAVDARGVGGGFPKRNM